MDWKIPTTIVILTAVVSLGFIPFFSPEFSDSIGGVFDNVENIFNKIFQKEQDLTGDITFSLSTENLDKLKIGTPTEMKVDIKDVYSFDIDEREITVKDDITFTNFTGLIVFENFLISGDISDISTESFEMKGGAKISAYDKNFTSLSVSNLKIGELTVTSGKINTKSPQKINANINDTLKLYGFQGNLTYKKDTIKLEGNCTKIESKGFTLGD